MTEPQLRAQIILDANVLGSFIWSSLRIVRMLNETQRWLQMKLIKQGSRRWKKDSGNISTSTATLMGLETQTAALPTDLLFDMPYYIISPPTTSNAPFAKRIELKNFLEVVNNGVLAPSTSRRIYVNVDNLIHVFPRTSPNGTINMVVLYTVRVTDLVLDAGTESEIPLENQDILIERVVKQILSVKGQEQSAQIKGAEIDAEIAQKYQLDSLKVASTDKEGTQ